MPSSYLIVDSRTLPDYYEKVVQARDMLSSGKARDVSEAARLCGISRSTYYKYKDHVFRPGMDTGRKAVIALMLEHKPGMLGELISALAHYGANILTITQSLPVHGRANVVFSLDMSELTVSMDELIQLLGELRGAGGVKLLSIE